MANDSAIPYVMNSFYLVTSFKKDRGEQLPSYSFLGVCINASCIDGHVIELDMKKSNG